MLLNKLPLLSPLCPRIWPSTDSYRLYPPPIIDLPRSRRCLSQQWQTLRSCTPSALHAICVYNRCPAGGYKVYLKLRLRHMQTLANSDDPRAVCNQWAGEVRWWKLRNGFTHTPTSILITSPTHPANCIPVLSVIFDNETICLIFAIDVFKSARWDSPLPRWHRQSSVLHNPTAI